jgi:hypothetical protein
MLTSQIDGVAGDSEGSMRRSVTSTVEIPRSIDDVENSNQFQVNSQ